MTTTKGKFDLVEQASIYGSYHNHPMNQLIHFICVPMIIFGVMLWFSPLKLDFIVPAPQSIASIRPEAFAGHAGMLVAVLWSLYCAALEPFVGFIMFSMFLVMALASNVALALYGFQYCMWLGIWLNIIGWGFQVVIGHGYYEKRRPALTDSLFQVIVSPFFLVLEFLFLFGYRPSLHKKVQVEIDKKIKDWKKAK